MDDYGYTTADLAEALGVQKQRVLLLAHDLGIEGEGWGKDRRFTPAQYARILKQTGIRRAQAAYRRSPDRRTERAQAADASRRRSPEERALFDIGDDGTHAVDDVAVTLGVPRYRIVRLASWLGIPGRGTGEGRRYTYVEAARIAEVYQQQREDGIQEGLKRLDEKLAHRRAAREMRRQAAEAARAAKETP